MSVPAYRHSEGCPGGDIRVSYRRDQYPRRRCSHCRADQDADIVRTSLQAVSTGRYDASQPQRSNEPKSLIQRALGRLRLS